jgi:ABC-2 type transport system permease protein
MLRSELGLLFRRRRSWALLAVLAMVPIAITIAVRLSGRTGRGEGPAFLAQVTHNGVFAALAGLTVTLPIFLPMAVSIVSGDSLAGEANLGTLRYLLVRPSGRGRLLGVKAITVAVFCLVATAVVALGGLLAGVALFPIGRITTLSGDTLPLGSGMLRIVAAAAIVGLSLLGLAAIGMFISTLTDAPVGAMAATLGLFILSGVLDAVPQVSAIHPWLLTHNWLSFSDLLRTTVVWDGIVRNVGLQALYVVVFGSLAWARFTTKDVLA